MISVQQDLCRYEDTREAGEAGEAGRKAQQEHIQTSSNAAGDSRTGPSTLKGIAAHELPIAVR
jgi:hypothetical protein